MYNSKEQPKRTILCLKTTFGKELRQKIKLILNQKKSSDYNQRRLKEEILKLIESYTKYYNITNSPKQRSFIYHIIKLNLSQSKSKSFKDFPIPKKEICIILRTRAKPYVQKLTKKQKALHKKLYPEPDYTDLEKIDKSLGIH